MTEQEKQINDVLGLKFLGVYLLCLLAFVVLFSLISDTGNKEQKSDVPPHKNEKNLSSSGENKQAEVAEQEAKPANPVPQAQVPQPKPEKQQVAPQAKNRNVQNKQLGVGLNNRGVPLKTKNNLGIYNRRGLKKSMPGLGKSTSLREGMPGLGKGIV